MKPVSIVVDYGPPVGTFTWSPNGIGGKPFPSEGQAHGFGKAVDVFLWYSSLTYEQRRKFCEENGI